MVIDFILKIIGGEYVKYITVYISDNGHNVRARHILYSGSHFVLLISEVFVECPISIVSEVLVI